MVEKMGVEPEKTTLGTGKPGKSEITREMVSFNKATTKLVGIIDELVDRLLPVLKPQSIPSEPEQKGTVVEKVSPLTETIKEERITINKQIFRIEDILQRLGL